MIISLYSFHVLLSLKSYVTKIHSLSNYTILYVETKELYHGQFV